MPKPLHRRAFLRSSAAAGASLATLPWLPAAAAEAPRVRGRVTLGRTGLSVPDIGFGASRLAGDEALVRFALDRGIDYFDTAENYTGGRSEETLGRALAGERERVILTSKVKARAGDSVERLFAALEGSLRRLRTDRIDLYFNHAVNDVGRLANDAWGEFAERAREQGKIRFTGMSGHGGRLVECIDFALERDLFDVLLVGYNFGQDPSFVSQFTRSMDFVAIQPGLPGALARAKQKNVGVVAMKTLRGARLNDMRPYERPDGSFAQAAFRWVLSSPQVDSLIVTMKSPERVEEYLGASGSSGVSRHDAELLARYESRNGDSQCRYGCGLCLEACPEGVPIDEVLRTRMYGEDYGDRPLARGDYAALGRGAEACVSCAHQACRGACPYGIDIPELTAESHRKLAR